ncbi:MAG TPA: site-specific integrase [Thermoanaerobacterales bacterium]|nr:site-specific integrase [Thermoanaerobacterales bacterium]
MKLPKPKAAYEVKTFSIEELLRIESTALYGYDDRYFGVLVSLYAGLRIGEICALRYTDIDFENNRLTVSRSLKRVLNYTDGQKKSSVIEEEPKTAKSKRTIPVPQKLCDLLKKRQETANSEYVICMGSEKYCEPRTFQFVYERLLEESDVEYRNHHCCRHTFVTRCLELGGDIKTISELVGHSGVSVTLSVYAHSQMETKERLMNKLNSQIFTDNNDEYNNKKI